MSVTEKNSNSVHDEQAEHTEGSRALVSIGDEVDLFIKQIDSLAETLPLTMFALKWSHNYETEKYNKFLGDYCEREPNGDKKAFLVPADHVGRYKKLKHRIEKSVLAHQAVPRSFIVSLISHYDAFLGSLIRRLLLIKPDILSTSDKNITFSQLVAFGSIEDAREYIVEKEVETVLRKSHSEQFDWLESKFSMKLSMKLREGLSVWPDFIEVTERRNLFVHNRGVVSNQYLDICRKHNVEFEAEPQVGEQLAVPPEYFNSAFETIFEIGVKLAHVLWRKIQLQDLETADLNLVRISYDLLSEERFGLARRILDFSTTTLKKFSSEQKKLMFVINQAQAYKWSGDAEMARKLLSKEDWSARSDDFRLAEAVLLDDFDKADEIVKRIGADGSVSKVYYREWPLFREYRKSEGFQRTFEEVFKEPFNLFSIGSQEPKDLSEGEEFLEEELPPIDQELLEDRQFLEDELPSVDEQ